MSIGCPICHKTVSFRSVTIVVLSFFPAVSFPSFVLTLVFPSILVALPSHLSVVASCTSVVTLLSPSVPAMYSCLILVLPRHPVIHPQHSHYLNLNLHPLPFCFSLPPVSFLHDHRLVFIKNCYFENVYFLL